MTQQLSPAAKAVLDAFGKYPLHHDNPSHGLLLLHGALPAALRAAADQVVPVPIKTETSEEHWALLGVKNRLLAIADELAQL